MTVSVINKGGQTSTVNSNAVSSMFMREEKKERVNSKMMRPGGASPDGFQPQIRVNNTMKAMLLEQMHLQLRQDFESYLSMLFDDLVLRDSQLTMPAPQ